MALILAAAMAVFVAACGSDGGQTDSTQTQEVTTAGESAAGAASSGAAAQEGAETAQSDAGTTAQESGESAGDAETAVIGGADGATQIYIEGVGNGESLFESNENTALKVSRSEEEKQYPESGEAQIVTKVESLTVEDTGYEALQAALDQQNADEKGLAGEEAAQTMEGLSLMEEEMADSGETAETDRPVYSIESTVQMKRADEKIFSYTRMEYSYLGGAHPNTAVNSYTFDSQTGEQLQLRDIAADYDALYEYVLAQLAEYEESYGFFEGYEDTVREMFYGSSVLTGETQAEGEGQSTANSATIPWFVTDAGVTVYFNNYDIGPYAMGQVVVNIPFESQGALFVEDIQ